MFVLIGGDGAEVIVGPANNVALGIPFG